MIGDVKRQVRFLLILNAVMTAWCVSANGQTSTSTSTATTPSMTETVREFDRMISNSDQLHRSTLPRAKAPKSITPVLAAIPQFRQATADFREAVGSQKSVRAPLQSIEKLIKPFAEYFKDMNLKSTAPDVQELKDYSQKDLLWETLTTAERVDNNLQIASRLIVDSNRSGAISIKTMQFYLEIDADLKRLRLLADRVETRR
jgi:hypothetical protein